jgi:hypothetical protein
VNWAVIDMNTSRFWCRAIPQGKIACSSGHGLYVTKDSPFIFISFWSLSTMSKSRGFHMMVNMNFCSGYWVLALRPRYLSRESTCDAVTY